MLSESDEDDSDSGESDYSDEEDEKSEASGDGGEAGGDQELGGEVDLLGMDDIGGGGGAQMTASPFDDGGFFGSGASPSAPTEPLIGESDSFKLYGKAHRQDRAIHIDLVLDNRSSDTVSAVRELIPTKSFCQLTYPPLSAACCVI